MPENSFKIKVGTSTSVLNDRFTNRNDSQTENTDIQNQEPVYQYDPTCD